MDGKKYLVLLATHSFISDAFITAKCLGNSSLQNEMSEIETHKRLIKEFRQDMCHNSRFSDIRNI